MGAIGVGIWRERSESSRLRPDDAVLRHIEHLRIWLRAHAMADGRPPGPRGHCARSLVPFGEARRNAIRYSGLGGRVSRLPRNWCDGCWGPETGNTPAT